MMLGSHPDLAVPFSPTGLWYRYARELPAYDELTVPAALDRLVSDILAEERIRLWDVNIEFDEVRSNLPLADYGAVVQRVHEIYAAKTARTHWVLHDIATLFEMDVANKWFSVAKFVHIVRDARDVALSFCSYKYGSRNLCETALKWKLAVHANLKMGSMLPSERYRIVRYEDLIAEPEKTLTALCGFIGVPYAAEMLDYAETVERKVPREKMSLWPALRGRPDTAKVGRWRERLPAYKTRALAEVCGDLLEGFAYSSDDRSASKAMTELYLQWSLLARGHRMSRMRRRLQGRRQGRHSVLPSGGTSAKTI